MGMTDEEIRVAVERYTPVLGPARAGWYGEACAMEAGGDNYDAVVWACRYREVAREMAEAPPAWLKANLDLEAALRGLLKAIDEVAIGENGVPEELWDDYEKACATVWPHHIIPFTSRPWADPT